MKIKLSQIHASPNPIRKSWDEEKMNDLRWSLMEEGQVEPIGVHKNGNGYTIVWGHRRTEAARRAGWDEIEAVVVPQDEVDNLIQAGIENLAGEDMTVTDKAEWAFRLTELGLSINEISRRSGINNGVISNWLTYRREKEAGVLARQHPETGDEGMRKTVEIARVFGGDLASKKAVAEKVAADELTDKQTRAVAEAYRDAPTPEIKRKVLETPIVSRDTAADILRRSVNRYELETGVKMQEEMNSWEKEREERREMANWDFAVKEFLDAMKLFENVAQKGSSLVKYGKYSPEAAKFAIRRIDRLIATLKTYREELEDVK